MKGVAISEENACRLRRAIQDGFGEPFRTWALERGAEWLLSKYAKLVARVDPEVSSEALPRYEYLNHLGVRDAIEEVLNYCAAEPENHSFRMQVAELDRRLRAHGSASQWLWHVAPKPGDDVRWWYFVHPRLVTEWGEAPPPVGDAT